MQPDLEQPGTLARLLGALPDEAVPPYGWSEFRRRTEQRARAHQRMTGGRSLAALVAIVVGIVALSLRLGEPLRPAARQPHVAADGGAGIMRFTPAETAADAARNELRTQMLERWLASLPAEPALVRVGDRVAVTGLEDRLAEVDDLLSAERVDHARPVRLQVLLQERRRLVSSLAQVRYAQTLADASR
jgi:hypothetical protein